MYILLYVKLMWCSGILKMYGQLEEGEGQKCMWCSGIAQISGGLEGAACLRLQLICKYDNVIMTLCCTPLCNQMPL